MKYSDLDSQAKKYLQCWLKLLFRETYNVDKKKFLNHEEFLFRRLIGIKLKDLHDMFNEEIGNEHNEASINRMFKFCQDNKLTELKAKQQNDGRIIAYAKLTEEGALLLEKIESGKNIAPENLSSIQISIHGGNISSLNLGTILGSINSNINSIYDINSQLAQEIKKLTDAISITNDFKNETKEKLLEQLKYISKEAINDKKSRNISVIKTILKSIKNTIGISKDILSIWNGAESIIKNFFEITTI